MYDVYANGESIYDPTNSSLYLFSPKVKLEFGKAGSFEFVIPPSNVYYDSLKQMKTVITVEDDAGVEIFRGRVLNISRDFSNMKTIYCEGDLAYLVDSVQKGEKYEGTTHALFQKIIQKHNAIVEAEKRFTIGNVTIDNRPVKISGKSEQADNTGNIDYKQIALDSIADNWNSTFDYIQTCIIDYCGGYLQTRRVGNTTYLDLLKNHDNSVDAKVTFGVNMLDLTEEANIEDEEFFTVLIPLGDENLTIKKVNNDSEELVNADLVKQYGRIVRTHVFSNVNQASTLLEDAKRYMAFNKEPPVTITVKAIDMHFIDSSETSIYVGDYVRIKSKPHDISRRLVCTEIEYDLINIENTAYTFGNPKQTLTRRYREDKRKSTSSEAAAAGGGGVGGAAAKAAEESTEDKLKRAHDAWFEIDPDTGTGSFGGLYREFQGVKTVLEREVGINFNAEAGNISLTSLQRELNAQGKLYDAKIAGVESTVNNEVTEARLFAEKVAADTGDKITAEIKTYVDDKDKAVISMIADKIDMQALQAYLGGTITEVDKMKNVLTKQVGINFDVDKGNLNLTTLNKKVDENGKQISSSSTKIDQLSTELKSQVSLEASHYSETGKSIAQIRAIAKDNESRIELKADTVTVSNNLKVMNGRIDALEGSFKNLNVEKLLTADAIAAKLATVNRLGVMNLTAASIMAPNIRTTDESGGTYPVASTNYVNIVLNDMARGASLGLHYHEVSVNDTTGTVTLGKPTSSPQPFNIRATKTYKDGVAAAAAAATVTIDQISVSRNEASHPGGESYNSGTHNTTLYVNATVTNGDGTTVTKPWSFVVDGTNAFTDGLKKGAEGSEAAIEEAVDKVKVTRITRSSSYDSTTHDTTIIPTAYLSNDHSFTQDETPWVVSGESAYNAGRRSITVNDITLERNPNSIYTNSEHYNSNGTTTIYVRAYIASLDVVKTGYFTTSDTAYQTGITKGKEEAATDLEKKLVVNKATGRMLTYNAAKNQYTVSLDASATVGSTTKTNNEGSYTFTASSALKKGQDEGANSLSVNEATLNTISPDNSGWELSSAGTYRYPYTLTSSATTKSSSGTVSDSKTTSTKYIYGTVPFRAGKAAVQPTNASIAVVANSFNEDNKTLKGTVTVTLADGTTETFSDKTIGASQAWNAASAYNGVKSISFSSTQTEDSTSIKVKATATGNDGSKKTGETTITATQAYKYGVKKGKAAVTVTSVKQRTYDATLETVGISDASAKYSSPNIYGCININLGNGTTVPYRVSINATKAFKAGKAEGSIGNVTLYASANGRAQRGSYDINYGAYTYSLGVSISAYADGEFLTSTSTTVYFYMD